MRSTSLKAAALLLAVGFVCPVSADDKTKTPVVLKPVEFQAAFVRAQLPRIVFGPPNEDGKLTKVWVLKNAGRPKPGRRLDLTDKIELVDIAAAEKRVFATEALGTRMILVAASFPYKQQVEEFRRKLRLPDHGAILSKVVRGKDGKAWPAFQFRGLVIERTTLDRNGKEGPWERLMGKLDPKEKPARQPFDLGEVYKQLVVQLPPRSRFEKDDPKLALILAVSHGLVMRIPAQYEPKKAPKLEQKLTRIQETLKKLEQSAVKKPQPSPPDAGFDPFGAPPGRPALKETPVDYGLIRFLDPSVEPGKAYRYRFKVKMANPLSAKGEELLSDWATVPQTVVTPPDEFLYAVDQAKVEPKLRARFLTPRPSQAVFQIHQWVDSYAGSGDREQSVGDWLVAARFFVERGEYVRTPLSFRLEVPVHRLDNPQLTLDNRPALRRGERTTQIPVKFGDESILVDFESGRVVFRRIEDTAATEVLIMRPEGKLIAHNSATDAADPARARRFEDYRERVKEAKRGPRKAPDFARPFD
jgi:hypothetical protein